MNLLNNRKFILFFILFWGFCLYIPSLNIHFVNDEIAFIRRCQADTLADFISLLDKKDFDGVYYRPAGNLLGGILTSFFGYNHVPYRIFNALLHAVNGLVLFFFLKRVTVNNQKSIPYAFLGSLIFLSFPLHDYAVIWHTDIFDRLLFSFYLLSLIFYLNRNLVLSLIFFMLAMLTKEMAFSLPFIIIILAYLIENERNFKKIITTGIIYFAAAALLLVFRLLAFNNNLLTVENIHSAQSTLAILKNYILMGGMLLFPFYLREIQNLFEDNTLIFLSGGILTAALFLLYFVKYRRKDTIFIFFILFIILTFLPASRLLMRWYLYLPSAGFAALISYTLISSGKQLKYPLIAISVIIVMYSSYIIHREIKWVEISQYGTSIINKLVSDYGKDIEQAEKIYFITIPAKVDDIPLFNLAFDQHLKHFIPGDQEYHIISKSVLTEITDSIRYSKSGSCINLWQNGSNYFILTDNQINIKFDLVDSPKGRVSRFAFTKTEEPDRIYFTFSHGKFFLIKG